MDAALTRGVPRCGGPKYQWLKDEITRVIAEQGLRPGQRIPSESVLIQTYGVSHLTVRRAISELVLEGTLYTEQGRGVFVRRRTPDGDESAAGEVALCFGGSRASVHNPHHLHMLEGASGFIQRSGYWLSFTTMPPAEAEGGDMASTESILRTLLDRPLAGVLCIGEIAPSAVARLTQTRRPVVWADNRDRPAPGEQIGVVGLDVERGVRGAVVHLGRLGHRRIALIVPAGMSGRERPGAENGPALRGYEWALRELGLPLDPDLIEPALTEVSAGHDAMLRLLKKPSPPTAVFAFTDLAAIGVIDAIKRSGLHVPRDIAVAGFGGLDVGAYIVPPLTTVVIPAREIGVQAARHLLDRIAGKVPNPPRVLLQPRLVIRGSCGGTPGHPGEQPQAARSGGGTHG